MPFFINESLMREKEKAIFGKPFSLQKPEIFYIIDVRTYKAFFYLKPFLLNQLD